ncbi:L-aminoadipate-semialdehyde dehydrogenase large subunit [Viridothelium virens]|uniref:Alpha-aminoadipate reductase n=1 Tax=Viridothelium virens TaxID=1048519 RepID=A0A6A6HDL6_VIRVR|nr:L-aminoadipate-semialdehyde dehydrogenase large subunit [Viridothelium virens]
MAQTALADAQPDPKESLNWNNYCGAIHEIFASNAQDHPDAPCVVETKGPRTAQRIFTYQQINESSNQLAHYFLANACEVGDVVMIYAYRGVELVIAYMGALKAGATVSVLDPLYPAERQKVLLEVASPKFLIHIHRATEAAGPLSETVANYIANQLMIKAEVPALRLETDGTLFGGDIDGHDCLQAHLQSRQKIPGVLIGPDSNPTLSFTSGSEGRPKGVLGRHFSLTHYFPWMAQRFGLSKRDRITMLSGLAHDPIQRDIFTALFLGARIMIPHPDSIAHELLAEWMKENEITVTHLTPAMGQILVGGAVAQFPSLHHAFFVGDLLTKKDCRKLQSLAPNVYIINLYGTTETQRAVSFFEIPSQRQEPSYLEKLPDIIPVGQGMLNVQLLVVDREDRHKLCQIGEQGELFLRAGGLAEGYLGANAETQRLNEDKFLSNWFVDSTKWTREYERIASEAPEPWMKLYKGPRDRIYRTGDLARIRSDGAVECTGRIDNQVKIRGFRIELGEIDSHLSHHPFIRENVTMVRRDKDEEPTLVTYIVPEARRWLQHVAKDGIPAQDVSQDESLVTMMRTFKLLSEDCKNFLKSRVPHYAVPTMVIPLVRMPLNPNGKIDKPALPFPSASDLAFVHRRASRSSSTLESLTETQKRMAAIWAETLPNRSIRMFAPCSNFFEEGGHSILAQQMLFKVKREWEDVDIPMSAIFRAQTLEAFAGEIDRAQDPTGLRLDSGPLGANFGSDKIEDEAYAEDARDLAKQLPKAILNAGPLEQHTECVAFVTGATGFLGSYILHELLGRNKMLRVIALVRCKDPTTGLARIEAATKAYGLWTEGWRQRLQVVPGDLSRPKLGLTADDWEQVCDKANVVIHNGAQVNWMLPYSRLRSANVLSTMACIMLCTSGRPKRLTFVSSTSTLDTNHYIQLSRTLIAAGKNGVPETDDLEGSRKGLGTGYGQSKWASEHIVRAAGSRGLIGSIVRPGYITGDPQSGISITDDFLVRLWKACLQVRGRPDIGSGINQVSVTQVSRIVVASAMHPPVEPLGVVHVTSRPRLTMNEWLGALETYGYPIPQVSYSEWCTRLRAYVAEPTHKEDLALLPLFHFVVGDLPSDSIAPELDDVNAQAVLRSYSTASGNEQPQSNATFAGRTDAVAMYLSYLVAASFLPPPPGSDSSTQKLPNCRLSDERLKALATLGGRAAGPK